MSEPQNLFLREALNHHASSESRGALLHLSPTWLRAAQWILLAAVGSIGLCSRWATVPKYVTGPAVIQRVEQRKIHSGASGRVQEVLLHVGSSVRRGDLLLRLDAGPLEAEVAGLNRQIEAQESWIRQHAPELSAINDLNSLKTQQDVARARLEERLVRAPAEGTIDSLRARAGEYVSAGELLGVLARSSSEYRVIAALPDQVRSHIARGMPLRFQVGGDEMSTRALFISDVVQETADLAEVTRLFGPGFVDTVGLVLPAVLIEGALPAVLLSAGNDARFGRAQVQIGTESVWSLLVPGVSAAEGGKKRRAFAEPRDPS